MIADVRKYARMVLAPTSRTEWTNGFNFKDIPRTRLDSTYHLTIEDANNFQVDQGSQTFEVPLTVRLFLSPDRNPKNLIDAAAALADTTICSFILGSNRLTFPGILNVIADRLVIEPLAESNDNGVIVQITFKMLVLFATS